MLETLSRALTLSRRELLVLVSAFVLSLPAVTPRIYASDEIQYFSYLRSLWFDHDVSFENEYQYFFDRNIGRGEGFHATFLEQYTDAGRRPSFATIGSALLWSPFYAAADLLTRISGGTADGFSPALRGRRGVRLGLLRLCRHPPLDRRGASDRRSGPLRRHRHLARHAAALLHVRVAALLARVLGVCRRAVRDGLAAGAGTMDASAGAVALGLSGALMAMVREQDVFLALGPAVDFAWSAVRNGRAELSVEEPGSGIGSARGPSAARSRRARASGGGAPRALINADLIAPAIAGCLAFAIGLLPQLLAYKALNGHFGPSTLVTRKMNWQAPHALEVLASPEHGFFLWTPLAALAIAGLVVLAVRGQMPARRIASCALLMVALQIYVSGSVESWTVAGAFGQRRFVALTILLTIGLAALLAALRAHALAASARRDDGALRCGGTWRSSSSSAPG